MAKSANIKNENSVVTLTLNDGSGYSFTDETLKEIQYEKMQIFQNLNAPAFTYNNIVQYWVKLSLDSDDKRKIFFFIFISFIPMMALYIIAAFSIINPRYQKNYAYHILAITTIGLYTTATLLKSQGTWIILAGTMITAFLLGLWLFRKYVERYF
jgi:lipopolysaccharide export system permease protein